MNRQNQAVVELHSESEKMADYVCIDEFSTGWDYFIRPIRTEPIRHFSQNVVTQVPGVLHSQSARSNRVSWGKFPCSDFSCAGCDDWLNCYHQNRKVNKLKTWVSQAIFVLLDFWWNSKFEIRKNLLAETRIPVRWGRPGQSFQGGVPSKRCCDEVYPLGSSKR